MGAGAGVDATKFSDIEAKAKELKEKGDERKKEEEEAARKKQDEEDEEEDDADELVDGKDSLLCMHEYVRFVCVLLCCACMGILFKKGGKEA